MSDNNIKKILKVSDELKNKKLIIIDDDFIRSRIILNGISQIELMGGKKSIMNDFVNIDKIAEEGIKARIEDLNKIIKNSSCQKIMVNNPYSVNGITLLEIANHLLEQDGKIIISGTLNNKYFKVLTKKNNEEKIRNLGFSFYFEKGKLDQTIQHEEFHQTSGQVIPADKMMTFYATKKTQTLQKNDSLKKEVKNR